MQSVTVSNEVIAYFIVMIITGVVVPVAVAAIYLKVKKERFVTVLVGALTFATFAIVLESIPKVVLFQIPSPLSRAILASPWIITIVGASLAGIFEETGRLVAFKFFLKDRMEQTAPIAYGLGHGLFEVMYLFVYAGAQYLVLAMMIRSGTFSDMLASVAAQAPDQVAALEAIPETLQSVSFTTYPLAIVERVAAVLFHVGASMLVFRAVRVPGKGWLYPLAILIHTGFDIIAGLGQTGVITNIYIMEAAILCAAVAVFTVSYVGNKKVVLCDTDVVTTEDTGDRDEKEGSKDNDIMC